MKAHPVTEALARAERGEPGASEALWDLVYQDLKRIAASRLRKLSAGETLQATALVHEAWLRLGGETPANWGSRVHFFGAAAMSMRNILVDQARRKQQLRRNAGQRPIPLEGDLVPDESAADIDILVLDEALSVLAVEYERPARILMLRYFTGLTNPEIAELLQIGRRTIDRELLFARTWLRRHLDSD